MFCSFVEEKEDKQFHFENPKKEKKVSEKIQNSKKIQK
jgi:hypothetical protein